MARILSGYLDSIKRVAAASKERFDQILPEDSPERRLLRGEFQRCVPVIGDDPCAWAFDGAIQQGWLPADEGIPVTSPWDCWFLDVRAPEVISWASGAPEVPWEGPATWGWVVVQANLGEGVGWACMADLILPHDVRLGGPGLPAVREWRIAWTLDADGLFRSAPLVKSDTIPFWRTREDAEKWTSALSTPLFRTLLLLNCSNVDHVLHRPPEVRGRRNKRGKRKKKNRQRGGVVYRVLQVKAGAGHAGRPSSSSTSSGTGDSVRRHLRRGHLKRWGYHNLVERERTVQDTLSLRSEDGAEEVVSESEEAGMVCSKCGQAEGELSDVCGTGHFGSGRKLVRWIAQTSVGSSEVGELEKMYSVVEHDV